ncbi:OLC1v1024904C1 [Oldenlandia corymbosa var. corymbosa]|uniref:OLC1v1024904C1 n=1 Tax=Oldenlandia corymbosa var. corymbosa TaxID=529605 RepID=A0AAV1C3S5_OLDCO|nr:OLC1v1024904C1 [Oldenlandia corymbosa var. corymbosa]
MEPGEPVPMDHDTDNPATKKVRNRDELSEMPTAPIGEPPAGNENGPSSGSAPSFKDSLLQGHHQGNNGFHHNTVKTGQGDVTYTIKDGMPAISFADRIKKKIEYAMTYSLVVRPLGRNFSFLAIEKRISTLGKPKGRINLVDSIDGYHIIRLTHEENYYNALPSVLPWTINFDSKSENISAVAAWIRILAQKHQRGGIEAQTAKPPRGSPRLQPKKNLDKETDPTRIKHSINKSLSTTKTHIPHCSAKTNSTFSTHPKPIHTTRNIVFPKAKYRLADGKSKRRRNERHRQGRAGCFGGSVEVIKDDDGAGDGEEEKAAADGGEGSVKFSASKGVVFGGACGGGRWCMGERLKIQLRKSDKPPDHIEASEEITEVSADDMVKDQQRVAVDDHWSNADLEQLPDAGNPETISMLKQKIRQHKPQIVAVFEPRINGPKATGILKELGMENSHRTESVGFAGGICIWKPPKAYQPNTVEHIGSCCRYVTSPWIAFGDFNAFTDVADKVGEENTVWKSILKAKYELPLDALPSDISRTKASIFWKQISKLWPEALKAIRWVVNDGTIINFWIDNWLNADGPLSLHAKQIIPPSDSSAKVADFIDDRGDWDWNKLNMLLPPNILEKTRAERHTWALWFGVVCWKLWNARNKEIFGEETVSQASLRFASQAFVKEVIGSNQIFAHDLESHLATAQPSWNPPSPNWVKINSDGATALPSYKLAAGGVIRNNEGD